MTINQNTKPLLLKNFGYGKTPKEVYNMTIQCKAKTDYVKEEQCSRQAKVKINGVGFCIPHAAKICLQQAIENGIVEPIDPENWFYKKIINKTIKISV